MQEHEQEISLRIRPTRLIRHSQQRLAESAVEAHAMDATYVLRTVDMMETLPMMETPHAARLNERRNEEHDLSKVSTAHLMQLSGMMRAMHVPRQLNQQYNAGTSTGVVEEWWPDGIQQTGAMPIVNLYGREPFGRSQGSIPIAIPQTRSRNTFVALLTHPISRVIYGCIVGIGLLLLTARFVDIPTTLAVLRRHLSTPQGIVLALLSGVAFLLAFSIRGVRWKLFLSPVGHVGTQKAIQIFLVGTFLNFLLPVRGGEVAKSLMLRRLTGIPISQSLPTIAMDKALDLMPALLIIALVPLLGVQMDIKLWLVLGIVSSLLIGLFFFVALTAWQRKTALKLLHILTAPLPARIANKLESFATGLIDSFLAGASRPRVFLPAILLTLLAVICDGLFAMLAFWTVGLPIQFGTALFGYTVYNMFYILPTPPGQVGSNEAIGLLVFSGLLHLEPHGVTAMFFFSHPWAALLMCGSGLICLSALGMTISNAMQVHTKQ